MLMIGTYTVGIGFIPCGCSLGDELLDVFESAMRLEREYRLAAKVGMHSKSVRPHLN
jgi:hypothetical protein